jgi:hypothetical protein
MEKVCRKTVESIKKVSVLAPLNNETVPESGRVGDIQSGIQEKFS